MRKFAVAVLLLAVAVIALAPVTAAAGQVDAREERLQLRPAAAQDELQDGYNQEFFCYMGNRCDVGMFSAEVWFKWGLDADFCPVTSHGTARATKVFNGRARRLAVNRVDVIDADSGRIIVQRTTAVNSGDAGRSATSLTPNWTPTWPPPQYLLVRAWFGVRWVQGNHYGTRYLESFLPFDNLKYVLNCP